MAEELRKNTRPDSKELYKETAWQLANRIIASKPTVKELDKYHQNYRNLRSLLETELLDLIEDIDNSQSSIINTKIKVVEFINNIHDKMQSRQLYKLLENQTVVGVGGQFSSGKSSFINAVFMRDSVLKLPAKQSATTSVPTFITHGTNNNNNKAHLCNHFDSRIEINEQELISISHDFNKNYGLNLSNFISFIDISSPMVPPNVVLLDTPGYSKADNNQIEAYSDFKKAFKQLRSVDYLIWAFDMTNGTVNNEDFNFIQQLNPRNEILFLACKSDLKTESEQEEIIQKTEENARRRLSTFLQNSFQIVPFSSVEYQPGSSSDKQIQAFLKKAQYNHTSNPSLSFQLQNLQDELKFHITNEATRCKSEQNMLEQIARQTDQFFSHSYLTEYNRMLNNKINSLNSKKEALNNSTIPQMLKQTLNF